VEGYFDLLTLFQNGIENTAATLGTALTEDHLRLIKSYAERAVLVFDADAAGMKAALRGSGLFLKAGIDARVLVLPDGHDPDSFVRESGVDAFQGAVEKAPGIVGFIIDSAVRRFGLSVEGKVRIINELQPLLTDIDDPVSRSLYIRELSDRIDVDERAIQEKIRQMTVQMDRGYRKIQTATTTDGRGGDRIRREFKLEKLIVTMLLQYPEMIPDVEKSGIIDRFCDAKLQSIGRVVIENSRNVRMNISELMEAGRHPELKQAIAALAMGELDGWSRKDCLRMIGQYRKISDPDRRQIVEQIKSAEAAGDHETVARLLQLQQQRGKRQNQKPLNPLG
jgi:DNA primase